MEKLGDILRKEPILTSISKDDTGTSSDAELAESPLCPRCKGAGFVYVKLPPGHPDFGKAMPCHCTQQQLEKGRLVQLEKYSNLGPLIRLTFDNLIPQGRSSHPANQERFSRATEVAKSFAQKPQGWLILEGTSGCGKTHLAAAIANYRINQARPVFFITVPDLLDHLRSTFSPSSDISYDELFEQVRNVPLLILDDLGAQGSTPWAQEKLFQIINHRFNAQLPTVVTTATPVMELDERLRTRLTDPKLCQIYLLEEKIPPVLDRLANLGLEPLSNMTFEKFELQRVDLDPEKRQNLESAFLLARSFAESSEGWLIFLGTNGCGKTHLAAAIANRRLKQGKSVFFVIVAELLDHLRSTFSPESRVTYDEFFETVKKTPLLILDDFGEQATTPWAREKLYQIINYRYNARLPTVVTTCLSLDQIEPRISSRMADLRFSTVFNITAPDYRADRHVAEKKGRPFPRRRKVY